MKKAIILNVFSNPSLPAIFLIGGNLLLFQPALTYYQSKLSLNYSFTSYLLLLVPIFLLFSSLLILPSLIRNATWKRIYSVILIGIAVSMWLATLLKGSQGELNGTSFVIDKDISSLIKNAAILALIGISSSVLAWRKIKQVNSFISFVNIAMCLMVIWVAIFNHGQYKHSTNLTKDLRSFYEFSKQKNVLVILLDTFQTDFFEELIKRHPDWSTEFSGFTFFNQATSVSPTTFLALGTIHSEKIYKPGTVILDYYRDVESKKSFVVAHQKNGYKAFILNPLFYRPQNVSFLTQDEVHDNKRAILLEVLNVVDIALFRSLPHLLKNSVYNDGRWLLQNLVGDGLPRAVISNEMLQKMAEKMNTNSDLPTIKFIHSFASHPPAILDRVGHIVNRPWSRENAIDQDDYAINYVLKVLGSLKKNGIYNQTAILIIADHGAGLAPKGNVFSVYAGMPLILFKPFNSNGKLQVSKKLVSLSDIPATICSATTDCKGFSYQGVDLLSDFKQTRKLKFNFYENVSFLGTEKDRVNQFEVSGPPSNPLSWHKLNNNLPPIKRSIAIGGSQFFCYYGLGWYPSEENYHETGHWATGPFSDLYLPLPSNKQYTLEFPIISIHKNQKITVLVNNQLVGEFPFEQNKQSILKFTIPAKLIASTPTHIVFKYAVWSKPPSPQDQRYLAALFSGKMKIY